MSRPLSAIRSALTSTLATVALLASVPPALAEPLRGVFGVTLAISGDGLFNPIVQSVRIIQVQSGLPAAAAGISGGDEVIEVDGKRVVGSTAGDLAPLAKGKRVGETINLTLKRSDGQFYRVRMVAAEAPR